MFLPKQLRKPTEFLIGFVLSGMIASIVVLSIASLFDANTDSEAPRPRLDTFSEEDKGSMLADVSHAHFDESVDILDTSDKPKSNFARKTSLYAMLMQADSTLLEDFFDDAKDISNSIWRREVFSAILRRLTTIEPSKALDCVSKLPMEQRQTLLGSVFHEWSLLNLSEAISTGSNLDPSDRKIALKSIVKARVDLPTERLVEIGKIFGYEKYARRLIDVSRVMTLIDTPRAAWEALLGDGLDLRFRLDTAVDIVQTWASRDGIGVLSEILESDTKYPLSHSALNLVLVRSLARTDPETMFNQAAVDEEFQFLIAEIAEVWAETNPIDALNSVSVVDHASDRRRITEVIMQVWSETNPRELLEKRHVLPKEMELRAISLAISSMAKTAPHEAIRFVDNLRAEGVNTWSVAPSLVNVWSEYDPAATLDWVLSSSNDQNPLFARMVETTICNLARVDPDRAMHLALNPPKTTWPTALDYKVILEIVRTDVDAAAKLLASVSNSSRANSYRSVGFEYVQNGNPERALELAEHLDPQERDRYYLDTFDIWVSSNSDEVLKALEHFPSSRMQELAADALIRRNKNRHFLSEKQLQHVKTYLSE